MSTSFRMEREHIRNHHCLDYQGHVNPRQQNEICQSSYIYFNHACHGSGSRAQHLIRPCYYHHHDDTVLQHHPDSEPCISSAQLSLRQQEQGKQLIQDTQSFQTHCGRTERRLSLGPLPDANFYSANGNEVLVNESRQPCDIYDFHYYHSEESCLGDHSSSTESKTLVSNTTAPKTSGAVSTRLSSPKSPSAVPATAKPGTSATISALGISAISTSTVSDRASSSSEHHWTTDPNHSGAGGCDVMPMPPVYLDNLANLALTESCTYNSNGHRRIRPEDFSLLKVIGKGSYGKVMMVKYKIDNKIYAMKMLRKENVIKRKQVEHTKTERSVLECISHPFIVQLYFAFQTAKKLYFVMEYCPGGELFFHLTRSGRFSENRSKYYAAEIILALEHLHNLDIVYRDLKPENVLLDAEGHIRLTDFGLSKEGVQDNFSAKSLCGTPEYLAPEILLQTGHGKAVDWWSLGALIYEMLTGLPPFYTTDREKLFEGIKSGELRYPSFISPLAKQLLMGLFEKTPSRRLGASRDAAELKEHPFFASINWNRLYRRMEPPPFKPELSCSTDVQYFDQEFIRLPVGNSEVPESNFSASAVRDEMFQGFSYDAYGDNHGGSNAGTAAVHNEASVQSPGLDTCGV